MWGTPLQFKTKNNEIINVLVFDSEGLASLKVDVNHDLKIFALILLLCSQLIYNGVGVIDEDSMKNLELVINISKIIHFKEGTEIDKVKDFEKYFPEFFWVIRDFILKMENEKGIPIDDNEYLERALNIKKDHASNKIRQNICKYILFIFKF